MPILRYLFVYQHSLETGVALGYAYRSKMLALAKLLCAPGHEGELVAYMRELAENRLAVTAKVETFFDLGMRYESDRIRENWRKSGITESQVHSFEKSFKVPVETV